MIANVRRDWYGRRFSAGMVGVTAFMGWEYPSAPGFARRRLAVGNTSPLAGEVAQRDRQVLAKLGGG